ncbi:MAG TPA: TlpA disulfide reductase family protein [Thermoanaerobaculia bacterium]|jgi:thiol-disulfide isomerase/thioredoxin|nr:TlpA disulfide reductase family protein [Thermoanaerobaculia bacterium]
MRKLIIALAAVLVLAAGCRKKETPAPTLPPPTARGPHPTATAPKPPAPEPQTPATSEVSIGSTLPPYTAKMLDGSPFNLAARRPKVVLLNLWATWCGPCVFEIPELEKLHQQYAARGFEVVGVSLDEGDPQGVADFVKEHKMTYPVAIDPEGKMANILQTSIIPTSVLLDRNGKVVWKKYEALTGSDPELAKAVEAALK